MSNLVLNPGFDAAPDFVNWTRSDPVNIVINNTTSQSPPNSAQFTGVVMGPAQSLTQTITGLTIGLEYNVSFYVRNDSTVTVSSTARIFVSMIPVASKSFTIPGGSSVWQLETFNYIATSTSLSLVFQTPDDVSITLAPVICYSGDSKVFAKNTITGIIDNVRASEIFSGVHQVFDTSANKFVPVKCNVVNGPTVRYMLLEKNILGENKPSQDFYVTSGHEIMINGEAVKARDIPGAKLVKVNPEKVYSICTQYRTPILINGLDVMTWKHNKFLEYANEKNLMWHDNQREKLVTENL